MEHRFPCAAASYNPDMKKAVRVGSWAVHSAPRIVVFVLLSCLVAVAGKEVVMPTARDARHYPAHDDHPSEKIAMAVDPYDMADKAQIFHTDYNAYGYMPVFFIVTNDSDQPVALSAMKAELVTVNRSKLYPASTD